MQMNFTKGTIYISEVSALGFWKEVAENLDLTLAYTLARELRKLAKGKFGVVVRAF